MARVAITCCYVTLFVLMNTITNVNAFLQRTNAFRSPQLSLVSLEPCRREVGVFMSSKDGGGGTFYNDFGDGFFDDDKNDDDDEDDEDDDDEYADLDVSSFRSNLESIMGGGDEASSDPAETDSKPTDSSSSSFNVDELISYATADSPNAVSTDWAKPMLMINDSNNSNSLSGALVAGSVLVANPDKFCSPLCSPALLSKFGLTLPPPADLNPDRRADLLPVLILLDRHPLRGSHALLLNRRTGYLMGDLEQQQPNDDDEEEESEPRLGAFMIQPLWFGGTSSANAADGLDMLHLCPNVQFSRKITEDGLYYGGDPHQAQEAMEEFNASDNEGSGEVITGFDFKFFVQSTRWLPTQLEKEVKDGTWFVGSVSKEVLFKSRDRLGTKRAKPLWTEIMELMGGDFQSVKDQFYSE
eukprot:CAMPEP_0172496546 /NCGR_PEP_ID=MMETSP1066-20121228/88966_1 /TAXON_ID=671091 /ORGANISM="Coscinodiscus wailesii, Strain CCMP2513" /LENGTH=412 /DNA_ID=CAMNT_0013268887 /DNA_START=16 /DNA_END=1254 /DNA_ORIENTATION=+